MAGILRAIHKEEEATYDPNSYIMLPKVQTCQPTSAELSLLVAQMPAFPSSQLPKNTCTKNKLHI